MSKTNDTGNIDSSSIKHLIESSKEPVVFNNLLNWDILAWDLAKWKECLGNTELQFRLGHKTKTSEPQWEKSCEIVKGTFEDFKDYNESEKWLYFDYKYLNQWFVDKHDFRNEINWKKLGYPDIKAEDCTMWIGSEGAHTPCHIDTYGYNLVAQIMGKKLWLLFPPETDLKATRIPYEESTIYSSINFYSPSPNIGELLSKIKCKKVILEAGQVLFVPNGWWHYVENQELSISINTWVPIEADRKKRVSEAITLLMVKVLTNDLKNGGENAIVNNTQELSETPTADILKLIESSIKQNKASDKSGEVYSLNASQIKEISENNKYQLIPDMSSTEVVDFLAYQISRFSDSALSEIKPPSLVQTILSALTDSDVLKLLEEKIMQKLD